jgi:hypothetical protein
LEKQKRLFAARKMLREFSETTGGDSLQSTELQAWDCRHCMMRRLGGGNNRGKKRIIGHGKPSACAGSDERETLLWQRQGGRARWRHWHRDRSCLCTGKNAAIISRPGVYIIRTGLPRATPISSTSARARPLVHI